MSEYSKPESVLNDLLQIILAQNSLFLLLFSLDFFAHNQNV